ncbi:MAG: redox-regulated ATPase YchF [Desulfurococcales archaeon]|nr:redox-regulated ATPase YchF [Desulfurococcales archaeon]
MEASSVLLGVVGKTNVGKSTFFSAATEVSVEIGDRPFVTIEPNVGMAFVRSVCPHRRLGLERCDARNSVCIGGWRFIPVKMMDVAGLVPGAHEGRGLGNRFMDHLRRADALILVVDASGSTSEEGVPMRPGSFDPVEEARLMMREIDEWLLSIVRRDWDRLSKQVDIAEKSPAEGIAERLSGLGVTRDHVARALEAAGLEGKKLALWSMEELRGFVVELRRASKPIVVVANKVDVPGAEENYKRLREELRGYSVIPASSLAELFLRRAARRGAIRYVPGDPSFEVVDDSLLSSREKRLLSLVEKLVLEKWGSTGVQEAVNTAVFKELNMVAVYPVEDPNRYTDKEGKVLPDALLLPKGSTARDLAYRVHTDLGKHFLYAINAVTKQRIGESYELQDGDVVKIVSAAK